MTTPLHQLLAAVPALNDSREPFVYTVDGDDIVGTWDIVKATTLYPVGLDLEQVDQDYRITVSLDAEKQTFDVDELQTSTTGSVGVDGGTIVGGGEKTFFKGRSSSASFSFSAGGITKDENGISAQPLVYSFETSRIKEPLFTFLEQHGWKRKKGFLGSLFNR